MKRAYYFIPLFVLAMSVSLVAYNVDFYKENMPDYDSYQNNVEDLIGFLKGENAITGKYSQNFYYEREIEHMADVQFMIRGFYFLMIFLAFVIAVMLAREDTVTIKNNLFKGGTYSLGLTGVVSLLMLNFSSSFQKFHEIVFTNDLWILPSDASLIKMFPEQFFFAALTQIVLYSIILSMLFIVLGLYIPEEIKNGRKKGRRKKRRT